MAMEIETDPTFTPTEMKLLDSSDGDGCKHCKCKRSKCLKLYCDCFAAGIYCAELCACQECFNRPEYEDIVLETRLKIESKDPFAFAPKVAQDIVEQPAISYGEDGTHFTPASARHKKGCNCRKSICLKKYCECFLSNVGCSDGCLCEGCLNIYGQKEEYCMSKVVLTGEAIYEATYCPFTEEYETFTTGTGIYHTELVNPHELTPLTPAVQFPNCGINISNAWLESPESSFMYTAPYMMSQKSHHGTVAEFSEAGLQSGEMGPFFGIPNYQVMANAQPFSENRNYSSGTSHIWRGSPITPMAQFSGSNALQESVFDLGLSDITPEMLNDSCTQYFE